MRRFLPAAIAALVVALAYCLPAHADGRAVSLSDARRAPDWRAIVPAHRSARVGLRCVLSDINAYRANGRALGPQHGRTWGQVTYSGRTFTNHSRHPVLVAVWCAN